MNKFFFNTNCNLKCEIVHYYEPKINAIIKSTGRHFTVSLGRNSWNFSLPLSLPLIILSLVRISRRFFRLDKSNAVFTHDKNAVVVVYRGRIFRFCLTDNSVRLVGKLKNCRNVLHGGIAVSSEGIYLGEYGDNSSRDSVDIIHSSDGGSSWGPIYTFPAGSIKHIHGVYIDPYTDRLWIPTGDFEGECFLISANYSFTDVIHHGDGSQKWRAVGLLFNEKEIVWGMDSPIKISSLQVFDRKEGTLTEGITFPGPVWYVKQLTDGLSLLQTSVEIGPGVLSNSSYIYVSTNLVEWECIASFKKDFLAMPYFKWGVVGFADGEQSSQDFVIFGEALKGIDGAAFSVNLNTIGD